MIYRPARLKFGVFKRDAMLRSYELMSRYVMPHFQGQTATMKANREWVLATGGGPLAIGPGTGQPPVNGKIPGNRAGGNP
jgi:hypothetical protein